MGIKVGDLFVRLGLEMADFTRGLENARSTMQKVGHDMVSVGSTMTASLTVPIVGIGTMAAKAFGDFESAMNKVAAISQASAAEFKALDAQARELGATTKFTASQAADAMGFLAMAGFNANQIMAAMPSTLQLAAAANIDLGRAADITSNILTGYGLEVKELGMANDTLVATFTKTNVDLSMLGEAFKYVGPIAKGVGLDFQEVSAAIGLLGNAGIQGSMGGTSLRKMISSLAAPTKESAKILKELGIEVTNAAGNFRPINEILAQFEIAMKKSGSQADFTAKLLEIFGDRGGPGMKALLDQGSEALKTLTGKIKDAGGIADSVANTQMKGLKGAFITMQSALEGAGIAIGSVLAPYIEKAASLITSISRHIITLVQKFETLPGPVKTFTLALLGITAVIGPVLAGLGLLVGQIANLSLLGPALTGFGGILVKFGGTANTVLSGLGPAAAQGAASMVASLRGGMAAIPNLLASAKAAFMNFGPAVVSTMSSAAVGLRGAFAQIGGLVASLVASLSPTSIAAGFGTLRASVTGLVAAFTGGGGLMGALAAVKGGLATLAGAAPPVTAVVLAIVAAVAALAAAAVFIVRNWEDVKAVLIGVFLDIWNVIKSVGGWIATVFEKVFGSFMTNSIKMFWTEVGIFFGNLWNKIANIFKNGSQFIVDALLMAARAIGAKETTKALENWQQKLHGLGSAAGKAQAEMSKVGALPKVKEANTDLASLLKGLDGAAGGTGNLGRQMEEAGKKTDQLTEAQKSLKKFLEQVQDVAKDLPKTFEEFTKTGKKLEDVPKALEAQFRVLDSFKTKIRDLRLELEKAPVAAQAAMRTALFGLESQVAEMERWYQAMKSTHASMDQMVRDLEEMEQGFEAVNVSVMKLPPILEAMTKIPGFQDIPAPAIRLNEALKELGIQGAAELDKIAAKTKLYADAVAETSTSVGEVKAATLQWLDAQIKADSMNGKNTDELRAKYALTRKELEALGIQAGKSAQETNAFVQGMGQRISTIFDDLGKGIADSILRARNLGDVLQSVFEEGSRAVLRFAVEFISKTLVDELKNAIFQSENLGQSLKKLVTGFGNLFGKGAGTATEAATQLPKNIPTSGAGSAMGGAGAANLITGAVSAVTGVLQYLQGRRMEQDIARVEVTSRGILNQIISLQNTLNHYLPALELLNNLPTIRTIMGWILPRIETIDESTKLLIPINAALLEMLGREGQQNRPETAREATEKLAKATEAAAEALEDLGKEARSVASEAEDTSDALKELEVAAQGTSTELKDTVTNTLPAVTAAFNQTAFSVRQTGAEMSSAAREVSGLGSAVANTGTVLYGAANGISRAGIRLVDNIGALTDSIKDSIRTASKTIPAALRMMESPVLGSQMTGGNLLSDPYYVSPATAGISIVPLEGRSLNLFVTAETSDSRRIGDGIIHTLRDHGIDM